jgi:hypothetical protein
MDVSVGHALPFVVSPSIYSNRPGCRVIANQNWTSSVAFSAAGTTIR